MSTQEPALTLIGLREATRLLPSNKPGKKVHIETLYRWIRQGRLRGWRRGSWWFVAKEDIEGLAKEVRPASPPLILPTKRARTVQEEQTWEYLRRAGIA